MSLLHALSYAGGIAAFAFIVFSLASGLLWIAELIEEHSSAAKSIGTRGVYAIIALHVLLYIFDSLPLPQVLFSVFCHVIYLRNFSHTWPFISLSSVSFIASCVLCIADHFAWFFYFSRRAQEARQRAHRSYRGPAAVAHGQPGFAEIATFFATCVWLVPLFLFLSLSANDNALPTNGGGMSSVPGSPMTTAAPPTMSRSSLFKTLFDSMPRLRARRQVSEGLIAPRTPGPSAPPSPMLSRFSPAPTHPPRSPSPGGLRDASSPDETYGRLKPLRLSQPPRRSASSPGYTESPQVTRRATDEMHLKPLGLGIRSRVNGGDDDGHFL